MWGSNKDYVILSSSPALSPGLTSSVLCAGRNNTSACICVSFQWLSPQMGPQLAHGGGKCGEHLHLCLRQVAGSSGWSQNL